MAMASRSTAILLLAGFIASSLALQVTPDSPCAPLCVDEDDGDKSDRGASSTSGEDITCSDSDYLSRSAGQKFQKCMTCLEDSGYSKGSETDQQWFLYNMRYSIDHCVFGYNATDVGSNPCQTSTACGAVEKVLMAGDLDPEKTGDYAFCDADDGSSLVSDGFNKCLACIRAGSDHRYLTNYLITLEAACRQKPPPGETVSMNDTVFASTQIHWVDPNPTAGGEGQLKLPPTTIAAITISGIVAFLLALGCIYMQYRKRVNRRNPKRGRRTVSSLSFHCRAALTPLGGRFSMNAEDGNQAHDNDEKVIRFETVQEEYEFDEKKELQERDRLEKEQQKLKHDAEIDRQRQAERKAVEAALEKPWKQAYTPATQQQPRAQAPPLQTQPARVAPPASAHSPTSARPNLWNPHNAMQSFEGLARSPSTSSKASSTRVPSTRTAPTPFCTTTTATSGPVRPKDTLTSIQTSLPTVPPQARFSPQSAATARFSPQSASDYYSTPTSAGSTAPLLKIKPYNPADFPRSSAVTGPSTYSPAEQFSDTTPMGVERRFFAVGSPTVVTVSPTSAVPTTRSPATPYEGGWPLPAGTLLARPPPPPPRPGRNQSVQTQSLVVGEEREYKNRIAEPKGKQPSGSSVESRSFQTQFPGPPRPPKIL